MSISKHKHLDTVLIHSNILITFGVLILINVFHIAFVCMSQYVSVRIKVVAVDVFKFPL